jgi:hypothetical protein
MMKQKLENLFLKKTHNIEKYPKLNSPRYGASCTIHSISTDKF